MIHKDYKLFGEPQCKRRNVSNVPLQPDKITLIKDLTCPLRLDANQTSGFYGHPVYLGGSALFKQKPRDIDLFIIIPDSEFVLRYINQKVTIGLDIKEKVTQWGSRFKLGTFDESNWVWCDDMVHKSLQSMRRTDMLIDLKVFPQSYQEYYYGHKPLLRLDTRLISYQEIMKLES